MSLAQYNENYEADKCEYDKCCDAGYKAGIESS